MPDLKQAVMDIAPFFDEGDDWTSAEYRDSLEKAKCDAAFAEKECESGFPLLHAHALVGCWGSFEAAIEDILVALLVNEPDLLQNRAFSKVRVPLAEVEGMEKDERMRLLVSELERGQGSGGKYGVDKFEVLLERFGLSGKVEAEQRRNIGEMHCLRNVIVHRASLADRRLVNGCPWLHLKVGDRVTVTHEALFRCLLALTEYLGVLAHRLRMRYAVDMDAKVRTDREEVSTSEPTLSLCESVEKDYGEDGGESSALHQEARPVGLADEK